MGAIHDATSKNGFLEADLRKSISVNENGKRILELSLAFVLYPFFGV